ncbi:hypothetical protein VTN77DRAFT_4057 [Rasamsonia byssochlamydoides]|uniref:uncharacterized protein n=1 Tax=Rasamsonia byssochlamydoides TaxID=89139 RepID=UPI0037449835
MASSRQERLQMRQRGAGTRKIKDVDFGFSFGSPVAAAPQQSSRQSPQPAPAPPVGLGPAERPKTPEIQVPASQSSPNKTSAGSQGRKGTIRTPGSSRNRLPERPSTFDIPLDEPPEQGRSAKRRKIGAVITVPEDAPVPLLENAQAEHSASPTQDAITNGNGVQPDGEAVSITVETPHINGSQSQDTSDQIPAPEQQDTGRVEQTTIADDIETHPTAEDDGQTQVENGEPTPDGGQKNKRGKRKPTVQQPPDRQSVERAHEQENGKEVTEKITELEDSKDAPAEEARENGNSPQRRETRRGRRQGDDTATETSQQNGEVEKQATKRRPGRRKAGQEQISQRGDENAALPEPVVQEESAAPASAAPEDPDRQEADQQGEPVSAQERPPKKRKQKQKQMQNTDRVTRARRSVESVSEEPEPEPEPQPEQEPEQEPEPGQEQEPELASEQQHQAASEPALLQKRRRGRPSGSKSKQRRQSSGQQGEEAEADGESKRGETVPVTVHRLANVAALDSLADDSAASSDEEESADELSTRRKFPNRGGVNPADVLSQICRETLEKTLATLKNGIANESNPARRSEWTRKRKAVEAYGAELEGRLFELSEMLDSNFVLGVQLRKAKREMAELRNRLLQVRQQRQDIALRMDEVRRKHSEEESAKMSRNTINNSLHSIELALDRNRVRNVEDINESGEDATSSRSASRMAGLEFLLRTVAENVSSVAPGAQGGLLNQVKAFNAQLEMAAKRLENN